MPMFEDKTVIAKFLYCSSLLEERVADAYERLSTRVRNPIVRSLLQYISYDSRKHYIVLKGMGEVMKHSTELDEGECKALLGDAWMNLTTLCEDEALKKGELTDEELGRLIEKMYQLESCAGEEYLMIIHIKILQLIADELKLELGLLKNILEWIVEDEKRHSSVLKMIRSVL